MRIVSFIEPTRPDAITGAGTHASRHQRLITQNRTSCQSVNAGLGLAWGIPATEPFVSADFFGTYIYSFAVSSLGWFRGR